jgi:hypothetical protein
MVGRSSEFPMSDSRLFVPLRLVVLGVETSVCVLVPGVVCEEIGYQ